MIIYWCLRIRILTCSILTGSSPIDPDSEKVPAADPPTPPQLLFRFHFQLCRKPRLVYRMTEAVLSATKPLRSPFCKWMETAAVLFLFFIGTRNLRRRSVYRSAQPEIPAYSCPTERTQPDPFSGRSPLLERSTTVSTCAVLGNRSTAAARTAV